MYIFIVAEKNLAPNAKWITRNLSDYWGINTTAEYITCLNLDTLSTKGIRVGYGNSSSSPITFTDIFFLTKTGETWKYNNYPMSYDVSNTTTLYTMPARVLSISDDGIMTFFYSGASSFFTGYAIGDTRNNRSYGLFNESSNFRKVNTPASETELWITHSPQRNEYLVTGGDYRAFTIPGTLSGQTTQNTYGTTKIGRACWCLRDNLYYGALYNQSSNLKKRCIAYSSDGYSWTEVPVFASGTTALGVIDLSSKNKLCALAANKAAISTDGLTWTLKDVPFISLAGYAYSPEYNLLCVADNSGKIYLTKNFNYWQVVEAPANVKFKWFFHYEDGIFIGAAYKGNKIYILTTQKTIT